MDKTLQDKFRLELIEAHQKRAWESFALYSYYGARYAEIEKSVKEYQDRIDKAQKEIWALQDAPENHTVENKAKRTALKKDVQTYEERINSVRDVMKKMFEESAKFQQDGVVQLEIADAIKVFKVSTPEEIAAKKEIKP
jgi:predicted  nucleic acid-binding Zn-ribbon protein